MLLFGKLFSRNTSIAAGKEAISERTASTNMSVGSKRSFGKSRKVARKRSSIQKIGQRSKSTRRRSSLAGLRKTMRGLLIEKPMSLSDPCVSTRTSMRGLLTEKSMSQSDPGVSTRAAEHEIISESPQVRPILFEPEPEHPNLALVKEFLKTYQNMELGRPHVTDDFVIQFQDFELGFEEYAREAQNAFSSMPNITFRYKSMEYREVDNTVVLENLVLLPVDTAVCEQQGETITFHFQDGKISKQVVAASW